MDGPAQPEAAATDAPTPDTLPGSPIAAAVLELSLHPGDLERLTRLPEVMRMRTGQARSTAWREVWADTPDGALAAAGQSLCERKVGRDTVWRLERLRGTAEVPWPPGTPPQVIAEAASLDGLNQPLPADLVPVAASDGVLRVLPLNGTSGDISLTILHAVLRAVAGEQKICRVWFRGPAGEIEALALTLTHSVRLTVPPVALAAEALTVAGRTTPTRPLGAPALIAEADVSTAFANIVAHLTGVVLHHAPHAEAGVAPEPVHQMRVALRRLRSALALFRRAAGGAAVDILKHDLKSLLQVLGPARDWDVFTAGTGHAVGRALPDDRPVARLLAASERKRQDCYAALTHFIASPAFRRLGIRLACLGAFRPWSLAVPEADSGEAVAKQLALQAAPLREFAAHALSKRLERLLTTSDDLSALTPPELHALRIQGKRMRYAAEFFAALYPSKDTRRFLRRSVALQERLGRLNDGAVAAGLMADLGGMTGERGYAVGVVRGYVAAGQRGTHAKMERSWRKFRRSEPFWQ